MQTTQLFGYMQQLGYALLYLPLHIVIDGSNRFFCLAPQDPNHTEIGMLPFTPPAFNISDIGLLECRKIADQPLEKL